MPMMPSPAMPSPGMPAPPGGMMGGMAGTSPAMPGQVQKGGREARGMVLAGLGLELLRASIPLLGTSEIGVMVTEAAARIGKKIQKPPQDIGESELTFMKSQLYGQGQGQGASPGGPGAAPQGPPPMPMPSMPAPMGG